MSLFDDKRYNSQKRVWARRREVIRAWKAAGRPVTKHFNKSVAPDITFPRMPVPDQNNPAYD